jgi:hypothetical protein
LNPQKLVDPKGSSNVLTGGGSPLALELGLDVLRGDGYGMDDKLGCGVTKRSPATRDNQKVPSEV